MAFYLIPAQIRRCGWLATAGGVICLAGAVSAQPAPDRVDLLLDLLVKKGIVSAREAGELRNQVGAQAPSETAPIPAQASVPPAPLPPSEESPPIAPRMPVSGAITANVAVTPAPGVSPLFFRIGSANFSPIGFLDFTAVYRNATNGGDIGSSFGSFPYANTAAGQLSETRLSVKNSRVGLRVDSNVGETKVLGYLETDFLGNAATNVNVVSNSDVLRLRVFFLDLQSGPWEFLAGQDWSMLTPNRKGLSPLPSDIFYTQVVDTNYQVGLVWGRTPQFRVMYHADDSWTFGLSAENPEQYVGSAAVLPANFNAAFVDTGASGTATPNLMPDLIGKIAWDTKLGDLPFHADLAGLFREFRVNTFATGASPVNADSSASGEGVSLNAIANLAANFSLVGNAFVSDGGGRYISTALGPDFIVNPANAAGADTISTVRASAGIGGFEWDATPQSKIYGYYGVANYGRTYDALGNGSYVGYGFPGSATTNNKQIEEFTLGLTQVLWKGQAYGDLKLMLQASYFDREPWYVAPGTPAQAHIGMCFANLRYDLP